MQRGLHWMRGQTRVTDATFPVVCVMGFFVVMTRGVPVVVSFVGAAVVTKWLYKVFS